MTVYLNDDREPHPPKRLVYYETRIKPCETCGDKIFTLTAKSLGVKEPDRYCCKTCEMAAGMVKEGSERQ